MKQIIQFLRDERGDIIQNLGWLVAVSIGTIVVGGMVYQGIKSYGERVKNSLDGLTITPP